MKLTITIPSRRYYVDELVSDPANPTGILSSLADTFAQFNILKERAYNRLYDEKYLGIKLPEKLPAMIKKEAARRFGIRINDYYITSIYSRASGLLSSQKELQKLYDQEFKERQENREEKIKSLEEELARKQELKALFVARSKARKAGLVFADELFEPFKIRFRQDSVFFHGKKNRTVCLNAYLYECRVDREIRSLKQRIALIKDKIKRADSMYRSEPKRAVFGSRKQYREKDTVCRTSGQQEQWHKERTSRRFHSVHFSGRHTSQYGNFQCRYDVWAKKVEITLIDGKVLTLSNISFPYRGRELLELRLDPLHPSVGYSLEYRKDGNGREYFILKASFPVENDRMNYDMCSGVIAADLNYDHIAWAELNKDGCMTDCGVIGFSLEGLNSGEAGTVLGKACKELVRICSDRKKPLAKEKLDIKKTRLEYGNKKANRRISGFAYSRMNELIHGQAFRAGIGVLEVNPAYTSLLGKIKYMRQYGISIHCAAACVIGRRAMGFHERLPKAFHKLIYKVRKDGSVPNRNKKPFQAYKIVYSHVTAIPARFWYQKPVSFSSWKKLDAQALAFASR